jgi:formylglycine-generating enzyme required for sulfatase activity
MLISASLDAATVAPGLADSFGSGAYQFAIDFVWIGNPGNAADNTGYGTVNRSYRMGTYEVSRGMITSYNALSGSPAITLADMSGWGGNGLNRPATGVSWNEAARFVNWLNLEGNYAPAYKFTTLGGDDNISLWTADESGYDPANPFRNSNAHYFLPSENEWYKAAYYDTAANGGAGGYWNYATGSDTFPTTTSGGTLPGTAVFPDGVNPNPPGLADTTNAGGLSAYGTMAQNGNANEWNESAYNPLKNGAGDYRAVRGSHWGNRYYLASAARNGNLPWQGSLTCGFRVAAVPEPSATGLIALGGLGLLLRRRRG